MSMSLAYDGSAKHIRVILYYTYSQFRLKGSHGLVKCQNISTRINSKGLTLHCLLLGSVSRNGRAIKTWKVQVESVPLCRSTVASLCICRIYKCAYFSIPRSDPPYIISICCISQTAILNPSNKRPTTQMCLLIPSSTLSVLTNADNIESISVSNAPRSGSALGLWKHDGPTPRCTYPPFTSFSPDQVRTLS